MSELTYRQEIQLARSHLRGRATLWRNVEQKPASLVLESLVADLLDATLVELGDELDLREQHETCDRKECRIGAAVSLARHVSGKEKA